MRDSIPRVTLSLHRERERESCSPAASQQLCARGEYRLAGKCIFQSIKEFF